MNTLRGPRLLYTPIALAFVFAIAVGVALLVTQISSQPTALASQCTLSVLGGSIEYQSPETDSWQMVGDGIVLEAGGRVRTGPESCALLTFFEGSTIKLEPGADVQIQRVQVGADGGTEIVLKQWLGTTWSRVVQRLDPGSHYEIQTPTACAVVRGTLFETEVDETGATTVRTISGLVSVTAQNEEVLLSPNQESTVLPGLPPSLAQIIAPPENKLVVSAGMPAVASVCDPTGASVGFLPSGLSFNQITGAQSTSPAEGTQVVTVPDPRSGEYLVVLRGIAEGTSQLIAEGQSFGQTIVKRAAACPMMEGSEWMVPIEVTIENGLLLDVTIGEIQPLEGSAPENLAESEMAAPALEPIQPPGGAGTGSGQPTCTLQVTSGDGGSVLEPGEGSFVLSEGTNVELIARPNCGYEFAGWSGDVTGTLLTTEITVDADTRVEAQFVRSYMLVLVAMEGGSVAVPNQGILYFRHGEVVGLVARADAGWVFTGWTGNVADPDVPTTTLTMTRDEVVTANFAPGS
jgi:hypothetical protein